MNPTQIILYDKVFEQYISGAEISVAVKNMAQQINRDMKDEDIPVFLSVLNGAFMFTADLMKYIDFKCRLSFVKLSSYNGVSSAGTVKELIGLNQDVTGKTVILLEDVIDSGTTLEYLVDSLSKYNLKQLKIATMLFKPDVYNKNIKIDYAGIHIPDNFIVGYGLDYNELGRNYQEIYKIKK
ncbi:MAG: hypoxanthine phosphoribosyltransferase [Prevotellaceae bacterium]|jgi:hypoxanthine phosphoribosyltransferase|nr:hypoxanthine phosphoribosyltransferase [Prevotellaceae bacterium]